MIGQNFSQAIPTCLWLVRISSGHSHLTVIGQCITWPSLQFPARQEVNIFIIFYGILPTCCRYLVHIILNQVSRHSDHKQWCCGTVIVSGGRITWNIRSCGILQQDTIQELCQVRLTTHIFLVYYIAQAYLRDKKDLFACWSNLIVKSHTLIAGHMCTKPPLVVCMCYITVLDLPFSFWRNWSIWSIFIIHGNRHIDFQTTTTNLKAKYHVPLITKFSNLATK